MLHATINIKQRAGFMSRADLRGERERERERENVEMNECNVMEELGGFIYSETTANNAVTQRGGEKHIKH